MLIHAGFDIAFECPARTPMLLQLNVHPSREADLRTPDVIKAEPDIPMSGYLDLFGNRVTRVDVPPGLITFSNRFVIYDLGEPDETPPDTDLTPIALLPDEAVATSFQAAIATATISRISPGRRLGDRRRPQRAQAISDFVHSRVRFSYPDARPTRCASDTMREGIGVCRTSLTSPSRFADDEYPRPILRGLPWRYRRAAGCQPGRFQRLVRGLP